MVTLITLSAELQQLKADMQQLRGHVDPQHVQLTDTFSQTTTKIVAMDGDLRALYGNAEAAIRAIITDLAAMKEEKGKPGQNHNKYWLRLRDLMPSVLTKREEWEKSKKYIEDYMENMEPGLKGVSGMVAKATEEPDQVWFVDAVLDGWESRLDLVQLLRG